MGQQIAVTVAIDPVEVLCEVATEELESELESRGARAGAQQAADDAIKQIRRGDYQDAVTTLQRQFFPKWSSVEQSRTAFEKAVA